MSTSFPLCLRHSRVGGNLAIPLARVRARGFVAFCGILSYFVEFCRWWEEGRRAGSVVAGGWIPAYAGMTWEGVVVRRVGGGGGWGLVCFAHGGISLCCGLDGVAFGFRVVREFCFVKYDASGVSVWDAGGEIPAFAGMTKGVRE